MKLVVNMDISSRILPSYASSLNREERLTIDGVGSYYVFIKPFVLAPPHLCDRRATP